MTDKPKCPICGGAGFKDGKICVCITGNEDDVVKTILGIFDEAKK